MRITSDEIERILDQDQNRQDLLNICAVFLFAELLFILALIVTCG